MMNPSIIYLVDNDTEFKKSVTNFLKSRSIDIKCSSSVEEYLESIDYENIEEDACLLCKVDLPGITGIDLVNILFADEVNIPTVLMVSDNSIIDIKLLPEGPAPNIIKHPFSHEELFALVSFTLFQSKKINGLLLDSTIISQKDDNKNNQVRNRISELSERERQILGYVFEGLLNKLMADRLNVSVKTVEFHRASMMKKMQAKSVIDLVKMTAMAGGI